MVGLQQNVGKTCTTRFLCRKIVNLVRFADQVLKRKTQVLLLRGLVSVQIPPPCAVKPAARGGKAVLRKKI